MQVRVGVVVFSLFILTALSGCTDTQNQIYQKYLVQSDRATGASGLQATWLGTTGILLTDGERTILIDPFITRPSKWEVLTGRVASNEELVARWLEKMRHPKPEVVLVNHTHYDHALDATEFAQQTGSILVGSDSLANLGKGAGLPAAQIKVVKNKDVVKVGDFTIYVIKTCHGTHVAGYTFAGDEITEVLTEPASALDYQMGSNFAFVIEHPQGTVLHKAGTCALKRNFANVKVDVAFQGVAGWTSAAEIMATIIRPIEAGKVVPMHFDDFTVALDKPISFLQLSQLVELTEKIEKTPGVEVETWPIGHPVRLNF